MKRLVASLSVFVVLLFGCRVPPELTEGARRGPPLSIVDPARREGLPLIMVAMPDSPAFHATRRTLVDELKKDFNVVTTYVDRNTTATEMGRRVEENRPQCVVLMDNPTVRLYRSYQKNQAAGGPSPAVVVVMTSFLEELRKDLRNASGLAYEVPGMTAFVNLRAVLTAPVARVGVVHRPSFRRFIGRQKTLAAKEEITLVPVEVGAQPTAGEVRAALRSLGKSVDALWVLNDNVLLRSGIFLETAWRPELARMGVPVIVGVQTLVKAEAQFGTFAVLPDHEALGAQAANLVFELSENDWRADEHPIELPLSTVTVVNMRQVRERFGLRDGAMTRIDRTVE